MEDDVYNKALNRVPLDEKVQKLIVQGNVKLLNVALDGRVGTASGNAMLLKSRAKNGSTPLIIAAAISDSMFVDAFPVFEVLLREARRCFTKREYETYLKLQNYEGQSVEHVICPNPKGRRMQQLLNTPYADIAPRELSPEAALLAAKLPPVKIAPERESYVEKVAINRQVRPCSLTSDTREALEAYAPDERAGVLLAFYRTQKNWSQRDMARRVYSPESNCGQTRVSNLERGERRLGGVTMTEDGVVIEKNGELESYARVLELNDAQKTLLASVVQVPERAVKPKNRQVKETVHSFKEKIGGVKGRGWRSRPSSGPNLLTATDPVER